MSDARRRILDALRRAGAGRSAELAEFPVRRFDWDPAERLRRFRERMEAVRGEVHAVGADWPERLCEIVHRKGARNLLYGPVGPLGPELKSGWPHRTALRLIPYPETGQIYRDALFEDVDAAFTSCRGAIAETGSVALWPTPEEPRLMSLVPPIHAVLLDARHIHTTFAELLSEQGWADGMPTNALLISGPSKSADIEQTLAYGVHGPKDVVVLIRDAA
jgi:L-lactate dehydrogenase complex protein LldG